MLVKLVRSQTSKRQDYFLSSNHLKLVRLRAGRYRVLRSIASYDGQLFDDEIGYTFLECGYHIFVPRKVRTPSHWFFGVTRCDAIAGYLDSCKSPAPAGDK